MQGPSVRNILNSERKIIRSGDALDGFSGMPILPQAQAKSETVMFPCSFSIVRNFPMGGFNLQMLRGLHGDSGRSIWLKLVWNYDEFAVFALLWPPPLVFEEVGVWESWLSSSPGCSFVEIRAWEWTLGNRLWRKCRKHRRNPQLNDATSHKSCTNSKSQTTGPKMRELG